ncbi:MAG: DUF2275 domain-containing protein [Spirochaetota bacterium]|nr:DUF2275 domain-containing protein [Spirochaetota bacterium]
MNCNKVKHLIAAYVYNELEPEMIDIVKEHISTCNDCQDELTFFEKYKREMTSVMKLGAPDDFLKKVHIRIFKPSYFQQTIRRLFVPVKIKIPLEAAGVLVLVFFAIFLFKPIQPEKKELQFAQDDMRSRISKKPEKLNTPRNHSKIQNDSLPINEKRVMAKAAAGRKPKALETLMTFEIVLSLTQSALAKQDSPEAESSVLSDEDEPLGEAATSRLKEERLDYAINDAETAETKSPKRLIDKKEKDLRNDTINQQIDKVIQIIELLEGRVIQREKNPESNHIQSIITEIPFHNYRELIDELNKIGRIQKKYSSLAIQEKKRIRMKIKLNPLNKKTWSEDR